MTLEQQALTVRQDRDKLFRMLLHARSLWPIAMRKNFGPGVFDFDNACLHGNSGTLQWKLRRHPDQPISADNQQTNCGIVIYEQTHTP